MLQAMENLDFVMTTHFTHAARPSEFTRRVTPEDAELVYQVYCSTPAYFDVISIPDPTLIEVQGELEAAFSDARRFTELILAPTHETKTSIFDPVSQRYVIGYLDYKLDYPEEGDSTVNLLLILESLQSQGFGRHCVLDLEDRLRGQANRILASIYGQNHRAEAFWKALGYSFAIDAKPILDWYAKNL